MGICGSSSSSIPHIMLVGIENSGKTFFLYSQLKHLITSQNNNIRTKPTDAFNYELCEIGSFNVAIWDLPGRENLRMFWPNFYRNIDFSGVIYMMNYDNKDTLNESVKVMHDLLSEEELQDVNVLIVLNKAQSDKKKKDLEKPESDQKKKDEDDDDIVENTEEAQIKEEIKRTIYFDLIKQEQKDIYYLDLFDQNLSHSDMEKTGKAMKNFISCFD